MPLKRNLVPTLLLAVALVAAALWLQRDREPVADGAAPPPAAGSSTARHAPASAWPAFLPKEARPVLRRIADGGPHPYRQDGSVFQNREGRLPSQPRGYYREYTVETPGLGHRGARRIVTGGQPPAVYYYTDDHYDSFRRFEPPREPAP
ncbi:ribonuclease [Luteimonas marina]|uniref:Ribonuclease n=1 Tax=Luteimonas marina TaxID=488485 RepID=A0A5C5UBC9_9GAMM|nr:ribonuclease domain-containing protein [Luteimonas marina]TWT23177.1 ribonuclease [Luteimonas marina]